MEDDTRLDARLVGRVLEAVEAGDAGRLTALLDPLHAADIADLLEQIGPGERRGLIALWGREIDGEILSEIDEAIREEVVGAIPRDVLAEAVRELDSDDVVDILEDLEAPEQALILGALEQADRVAVEAAMAFPEGSAGRLMQREVVVAPQHWTVGEAIDFLRGAEHLPEQFYHVILVDPRMRPVGYVTLGRILSSAREVRMAAITEDSFRTVAAADPEGDVAYIFNQYHLISCPVVDAGGRLVGVITIDDAMNVLDEEHEEDILRLAGVGDDESLSDGPLATARARLPWLAVNLVTASLSALVISGFQSTIADLVVLAALMPIVASTGGIAGTQSLAVAVRALATRSLTAANARRVVLRELGAGVLNGVGLALILGAAGAAIFGQPMLGVVLGLAMMVNQVVAAMGGVLVPLTLSRVGLDPALASGTFVTTLTDVMGFFAFLGLATVLDMSDVVKIEARRAAFARRKEAFAAGQGRAVEHLAVALLPYAGRVLSGYMPMRTEINPLTAMAGHDGPVCVPVIEGRGLPLRFRRWTPDCTMVTGEFGALIPETGDWLEPEVLIVPLLAWDRRGYRLGYGGGYYDRTLERLRGTGPRVAIGFAFAAQEVGEVPVERFDQVLDHVVTEDGVAF